MKNNFFKIALLFAALVVFAFATYLYRPVANKLTRVTVSDESQTKISPASVVIMFSVVTQNSLAVNAQQENIRKSEAVINSIKSLAADAEIKKSVLIINQNALFSTLKCFLFVINRSGCRRFIDVG